MSGNGYAKPAAADGRARRLHSEDHPELKGPVGSLFGDLRRRVLNLESGVSEEVRKRYIAYKLAGNFLCVVPLKTELNTTAALGC